MDENKKLVKCLKYKDWKLNVKVEHRPRDTPKKNSLVEQGFAFMLSKTRAVLNAANVPQEHRYKRFSECAMTMTKFDGLNVLDIDGETKTRTDNFGYSLPKFAHYL